MLNEFRSTNITWDKATSRIYSPITANESDENGRKLVVQIVNGGQVEDLTGAALHLYWETRDKAHDGLDVFKAVDLKNGEFELSYTTGMLSNKGALNANLVLIDTVGRVVSEQFKITVTKGIDNDAIQSENSFSSLTQALIDVSNLEQTYAPRLNDLTAQLAQKVSKGQISVSDINKNLGKFDQTYMTDEFLQQMAGTTPINAIPADNSLTTNKYADGSVTTKKIKSTIQSSNIFTSEVERGGINPTTGANSSSSLNLRSVDFISVLPNTTYTISDDKGYQYDIVEYNSTNAFVQTKSTLTFTTESNTQFIKVTTARGDVMVHDLSVKIMLNQGNVALPYETPINKIPWSLLENNKIPQEKLDGVSIKTENLEQSVPSNNLFTSTFERGTLSPTTGVNGSSGYYVRSVGFIELSPDNTYTLSDDKGYSYRIFEYDQSKSFISYQEEKTFTLGADTEYIRVVSSAPFEVHDLNVQFMINEGAEVLPYETTGNKLSWDILKNEKIPNKHLDFELLEENAIKSVNESDLSVVFDSNVDFNCQYFRIPALITTKHGTLIASAEARYDGFDDFGNMDVVVARSIDNGKSWEHKKISIANNALTEYSRAMCPTFIYDNTNDRIYLFAAKLDDALPWFRKTTAADWDFVYVTSDDDGITWSNEVSIKSIVSSFPDRSIFLPGIGRGVITNEGTFVLPIQVAHPTGDDDLLKCGIIRSGDGVTWEMSETLIPEIASECNVAIYKDKIIMNARREFSTTDNRRILYSTSDLGLTWQPLESNSPTSPNRLRQYNKCHGSTIAIQFPNGEEKLLYSAPHNLSTDPQLGRENIALMQSSDGGETWEMVGTVYRPRSNGYSSLAYHDYRLFDLLEVVGGNIEIMDITSLIPLLKETDNVWEKDEKYDFFVLKSPNGTYYKVQVDNVGVLSATPM